MTSQRMIHVVQEKCHQPPRY